MSAEEEPVTIDDVIEHWQHAADYWLAAADVCAKSGLEESAENKALAQAKHRECLARSVEAKLWKKELEE